MWVSIFNRKSIKNQILILAIFICITFFFYRIVDFSINYNYMFNQYHEYHQNQMIGNTTFMSHDYIISHTIEQEIQPNLNIDVSFVFDRFYGDDKGSLFYLIVLLASFFMIHLIFRQLFFLYVRRWLIKTIIILERYTLLVINYVHRKDGKKRYYPSYVHC
jgi:hypothetical protein